MKTALGQVARRLGWILWLALLGCQSAGPSADHGSAIREIHLVSMPVALNLDAVPGADGFAVKIFASDPKEPKPVAISGGTLDVLLYDGVIAGRPGDKVEPLRVWSYSSEDLRPYQFRRPIGVGYDFVLAWGENRPAQKKITVVGRYTAPGAAPIYSAPSSIVVVSP